MVSPKRPKRPERPKNYVEAFYNFKPYATRKSWHDELKVEIVLKHYKYTSHLYINDTEIARLEYQIISGLYELHIYFKDEYRFNRKICDIYKGVLRGARVYLDNNIKATVDVDKNYMYRIINDYGKYVYDSNVAMKLVYSSPIINIYAQVVRAVYFEDDEELESLYREFQDELYNLNELKRKLSMISLELKDEFEGRFNYLDNIITFNSILDFRKI